MKGITSSEYETLAEFRYALRRFVHFSEETAREVGLTPQQHQALLAIKGYPRAGGRIAVGELAERLQIQHHSAVGLVDRLGAQGLLRREPGQGDRRQVLLALTPKGERLLQRLSEIHKKELKQITPALLRLLEELSGED